MDKLIASVIIVNWNGRALLAETLAALRAQTLRDFETIVVDNGSTDGSPDFVAAEFPESQIIRAGENTGFAKGNNLGIRVARGEFVVLLNNDAVPNPVWLAELVGAMRRHPDAGFCASRVVLYAHPELLDSAGDGIAGSGTVFRRGHRRRATEFAREEYVFGAQACAAMYRRAMLDEIGLLDEDFFLVYEDADLSFRAQLAGYKCVYVPSAIVRHHGERTIGEFSSLYAYQNQRNVEYVFIKNMPTRLLWRILPGHLIYMLMGFVFYLGKRRGAAYLRGKWDALRALPRLLEKRKPIQKNARVSAAFLGTYITSDWITRILREKIR
ncbi:MAG: glycosyltransferase family 2 protein [Chloroflexi bacterium]|nr:glycosyltransferase family 2 protein [Chloroflexota bacterium]